MTPVQVEPVRRVSFAEMANALIPVLRSHVRWVNPVLMVHAPTTPVGASHVRKAIFVWKGSVVPVHVEMSGALPENAVMTVSVSVTPVGMWNVHRASAAT